MNERVGLLMVTALLLCGCTQATKSPPQAAAGRAGSPALSAEKNRAVLIGELLQTKLAQNGEKIMCDQPSYVSCFQITKQQCYSELSSFKERCLQVAVSTVGNITDEASAQNFSHLFLGCMVTKQLAVLHPKRIDSINQCLTVLPPADNDQVRRSLME